MWKGVFILLLKKTGTLWISSSNRKTQRCSYALRATLPFLLLASLWINIPIFTWTSLVLLGDIGQYELIQLNNHSCSLEQLDEVKQVANSILTTSVWLLLLRNIKLHTFFSLLFFPERSWIHTLNDHLIFVSGSAIGPKGNLSI